MLKLGDTVIPYHDDFKMYITTKLPNPHYSPEVSTKLTLINFTLSPRYLLLPHELPMLLSLIPCSPQTLRPVAPSPATLTSMAFVVVAWKTSCWEKWWLQSGLI